MTNYEIARQYFHNGDIVFFSNGKSLLRRLISWFTNGPHYHVGIAFWMTVSAGEQRLMLAEAMPDGYRIINLSLLAKESMAVFRCPVEWNLISDTVINDAGVVSYGFLDLIIIGLHEKFKIAIPENIDGKGDVCSVIVSKILQSAGLKGIDTMISPQRLYEQLSRISAPFSIAN